MYIFYLLAEMYCLYMYIYICMFKNCFFEYFNQIYKILAHTNDRESKKIKKVHQIRKNNQPKNQKTLRESKQKTLFNYTNKFKILVKDENMNNSKLI